jgi:hypothetical protein
MRKRQGKIECDLEANGANTSFLGLDHFKCCHRVEAHVSRLQDKVITLWLELKDVQET